MIAYNENFITDLPVNGFHHKKVYLV